MCIGRRKANDSQPEGIPAALAAPPQPMLVIDAYNALHVTGVLPPDVAGVDVRGLANLIAASRWRSVACRLVCDGTGESGVGRLRSEALPRSISVVYAGPGQDADTLIEDIIESSTTPRRLVVVSSDRRLRAAARRRRCRWLSSEAFLQTLAQDALTNRGRCPGSSPPADPTAAGETEQWLREFGFDPPPPGAEAPPDAPRSDPPSSEVSPGNAPKPPLDEDWKNRIAREWPGQIDPDDLDMDKWLDPGTPPESPPGGG